MGSRNGRFVPKLWPCLMVTKNLGFGGSLPFLATSICPKVGNPKNAPDFTCYNSRASHLKIRPARLDLLEDSLLIHENLLIGSLQDLHQIRLSHTFTGLPGAPRDAKPRVSQDWFDLFLD